MVTTASSGWISSEVWVVAMFLSCATGIVASLVSFRLFDRLLRLEHDLHPTEWERDGAPVGYFWVPPGTSVLPFSGSWRRGLVASKWTFRTPTWAAQDSNAKNLLIKFRIFDAIFFCATLMTVLLLAL